MTPRFVHFELPADDPAGLARFYTALFGWAIHKSDAPGFDYWPCRTGQGPGIDGAITKRLHPRQGLTNYVTVEDLVGLLEKARSLGATIIVPKAAVPGKGWYALALDPEGNPVGFWQNDHDAR